MGKMTKDSFDYDWPFPQGGGGQFNNIFSPYGVYIVYI